MSTIVIKEKGRTLGKTFDKIFENYNFDFGKTIFIKPNFSGRPPIINGENTDPKFLKHFVNFLISKGAKKVIVGHGALLGTADRSFPFEAVIRGGGFSYLYKIPEVEVVNFDKTEKVLVGSGDFKFIIPKFLINNTCTYINLAKFKTHMETTVSLSIKNQVGLVAMGDRVRMHHTKLEESIAALAKLIRPKLIIIDGIVAMEKNGPHHGLSKVMNLVFAGDDMVELDSIACSLVGIDPMQVKHIILAEELGVGKMPEKEKIDSFSSLRVSGFKPAMKYEKFGNFYAWPTSACSRCITAINECGKLLKKHPIKNFDLVKKAYIGKNRCHLIIGRAEGLELSDKEKIVCIGSCALDFAKKHNIECLDKCPPSVEETLGWIRMHAKDNPL